MGKNAVLGWPTWIGVIVEDLEGQRRFWGDLLGVSEDHSGSDFVDFELGDWRSFEVIQRSDDPQYEGLRLDHADDNGSVFVLPRGGKVEGEGR